MKPAKTKLTGRDMRGVVAPLRTETPSQLAWRQRANEAMARILAAGYNGNSKVRG